jgi:DNA sulfur modification protein DndB
MTTNDYTMEQLGKFAASAGKIMRVPALKGHLGGVDFFLITLTLGEVPRYIVGTDPNLPADLRENRRASPARFAEIANYIISNIKDYRFSALTCTYGKNGTWEPDNDKGGKWEPAITDAPAGSPGWTLGMLTLNQQDPLIIVDGQHRLGAIEKAIEEEPELRKDSIAIVLFPYISLEMNQQLFSDLNRTAKKTSKSLDVFFNRRDIENRVVQKVVKQVSVFGEKRVDVENISVVKSPYKVFTLAGVYQATTPMIKGAYTGGLIEEELSEEKEDEYASFLASAWEFIAEQLPEWGKVAKGEMNIAQERQNYLHWNSGVLSSIGEFVGAAMRERGRTQSKLLSLILTMETGGGILSIGEVLYLPVTRCCLVAQ